MRIQKVLRYSALPEEAAQLPQFPVHVVDGNVSVNASNYI